MISRTGMEKESERSVSDCVCLRFVPFDTPGKTCKY